MWPSLDQERALQKTIEIGFWLKHLIFNNFPRLKFGKESKTTWYFSLKYHHFYIEWAGESSEKIKQIILKPNSTNLFISNKVESDFFSILVVDAFLSRHVVDDFELYKTISFLCPDLFLCNLLRIRIPICWKTMSLGKYPK